MRHTDYPAQPRPNLCGLLWIFFALTMRALPVVAATPAAVEAEAPRASGDAYLRGWIDCGTTAVANDILVYDASGALLNVALSPGAAKVQSRPSGAFLVALRRVPEAFMVVARDVRCDGLSVAELKAHLRHLDPARDVVHVNGATTLLANHIERFPQLGDQKSQATVRAFLEIPQAIDLFRAPDLADVYFSPIAFLAEARTAGGVDPLLKRLLSEMAADPDARHPFQSLGVALGPGDAIGWVGENLASGAVSYAGGQLAGWVLDKIGLGFPDATLEAIKEMQKTLGQIKQMISDLSVQLDQTLRQLSHEISQTNYDVRIGQLIPLVDRIETISEDLHYLAGMAGPKLSKQDERWIETERVRLTHLIGHEILVDINAIHKQQVGISGTVGLIQVWSKIVAGRHRFLDANDSALMREQFDFYDALQLALFNLALEYHHAKGAPAKKLENLVETYERNRKKQLAMVAKPIPKDTVVETRSGLMIAPRALSDAGYSSMYHHFRVNPAKADRYAGYADWRMPAKNEIEQIFYGWKGGSVAAWAIAQGYPEEDIAPEFNLLLTNRPAPSGLFRGIESWSYSLNNGALWLNRCEEKYQRRARKGEHRYSVHCIMYPPERLKQTAWGYLMPVRQPGADEIYFY
jgi:hypothetical protein